MTAAEMNSWAITKSKEIVDKLLAGETLTDQDRKDAMRAMFIRLFVAP